MNYVMIIVVLNENLLELVDGGRMCLNTRMTRQVTHTIETELADHGFSHRLSLHKLLRLITRNTPHRGYFLVVEKHSVNYQP